MTQIGEVALWVALVVSVWGAVSAFSGGRLRRGDVVLSAERSVLVVFALIAVAAGCIIAAFVGNEYRYQYVAGYSNRDLATFYKVAGLWAGQTGSLVFWSLTLVVTIKYLTFILRADNHGEGGILALLALVPPDKAKSEKRHGRPGLLALLVVFGSALLYGDGVITPAISVLSAIEGLEVATSSLKPTIVVVRPWKLPCATTTVAASGSIPFTR